jgi:HK97 family phage major capsid protein
MRDLDRIKDNITAAEARKRRALREVDDLIARADVSRLSDGEQQRLDRQSRAIDNLELDIARLKDEWREAVGQSIRRGGSTEAGDGAPPMAEVRRTRDPRDEKDMISRALRTLETSGRELRSEQQDQVDRLLRTRSEEYDPLHLAERILVTESPVYRSAWMRVLHAGQNNRQAILTSEELDALRAYELYERAWDGYNAHVYRSMGEVTTTAGGFGVPVFIDPTIILTTGSADVPMLKYCRIEQVTTNVWKGVSSAGMSWSYDTEAAEVSDDSPTLAQPSITVHMARGFIPYSIEVGQDYSNFSAEMGRLLTQGYNDLLAAKTMTGSGTGEPWGIFTAIDQTSASEVTPTTDGSFGGPDIFKVYNSLGERFRSRAIWVMSQSVASAIRQFAAAAGSASSYFTVDLQGATFMINERPVITTDYAPTFSGAVPGTTGPQNVLVVGDPSTYVFTQRAGLVVEPVPHIFHTSNNRPSGQRGLFAWARNGADSVADEGWRLLQNQ